MMMMNECEILMSSASAARICIIMHQLQSLLTIQLCRVSDVSTSDEFELPRCGSKLRALDAPVRPNPITLSWSQTGPKLVADLLARASSLLAS